MVESFVLYLLLFLIGISLGSFFNVVIDRWPNNKSIVKKRSHCEFCQKTLAPIDLIPILSFLLLKGKCRYCHKKFSLQYPLVELTTGILLVGTYFLVLKVSPLPVSLASTFYLLLSTLYLLLIFLIDLKYQTIVDEIINSAIILTVIFYTLILLYFNTLIPSLFLPFLSYVFQAFLSGTIVALFFRFLIFISRGRGLGEGDVKLGFWLGLLLGFPKIIPGLFLGFVSGAIIGLLLIVFGQKKLRDIIPFAPFLTAGAYIGLFFGNQIITWYLEKFL